MNGPLIKDPQNHQLVCWSMLLKRKPLKTAASWAYTWTEENMKLRFGIKKQLNYRRFHIVFHLDLFYITHVTCKILSHIKISKPTKNHAMQHHYHKWHLSGIQRYVSLCGFEVGLWRTTPSSIFRLTIPLRLVFLTLPYTESLVLNHWSRHHQGCQIQSIIKGTELSGK